MQAASPGSEQALEIATERSSVEAPRAKRVACDEGDGAPSEANDDAQSVEQAPDLAPAPDLTSEPLESGPQTSFLFVSVVFAVRSAGPTLLKPTCFGV
jgi:hypothetical protein